MTKRKSLSKKIRFEVFKRDSFKCQYCGASAPSVLLEVDHIHPVKEGGTNDIMNLITSCHACNRGKSAIMLDDTSLVAKQRKQIEELNLRRQQLEMMLEWRDGIQKLSDDTDRMAIEHFNKKWSSMYLNEEGEKLMRSYVSKFGLINTLDAIDISFKSYGKQQTGDCFKNTALKVGGILYMQNSPEHKQLMAMIKGAGRRQFRYFDEKKASIALNNFYKRGGDLAELKTLVYEGAFRNWSLFIKYMEEDGIQVY